MPNGAHACLPHPPSCSTTFGGSGPHAAGDVPMFLVSRFKRLLQNNGHLTYPVFCIDFAAARGACACVAAQSCHVHTHLRKWLLSAFLLFFFYFSLLLFYSACAHAAAVLVNAPFCLKFTFRSPCFWRPCRSGDHRCRRLSGQNLVHAYGAAAAHSSWASVTRQRHLSRPHRAGWL